jgi:iron complex transport system substrate-binding protein
MTRLGRAGIQTFRYQHAGLADITATIRTLGDRIQRADEARAVADRIERDLEATRRAVAGKPRVRAAILFGREPGTLRNVYASGGVGFLNDMLAVAGGTNVFADVKRQSLQATSEVLLARAPEVIIEVHGMGETWTPERLARERDVWKSLASLPAVRSGRIHVMQDDRLVVPGPRIGEGARILAEVLHKIAGAGAPAMKQAPMLSLRPR